MPHVKCTDRYISAADMLEGQMKTAQISGDLVKASEINSSLSKLLDDLEQLKPEMEREKQEAGEAKEFYDELIDLAKTSANKVKQAREILQNAQRDMQHAEIQKRRAADQAAKAEKLAGLRKDTGGMGVALASMNKQAQEAKAAAAASELKTKLLTPNVVNKDANIEAALKAAGGGSALTIGSSVSDRLAALKKK